jgi:hypothetical protein
MWLKNYFPGSMDPEVKNMRAIAAVSRISSVAAMSALKPVPTVVIVRHICFDIGLELLINYR